MGGEILAGTRMYPQRLSSILDPLTYPRWGGQALSWMPHRGYLYWPKEAHSMRGSQLNVRSDRLDNKSWTHGHDHQRAPALSVIGCSTEICARIREHSRERSWLPKGIDLVGSWKWLFTKRIWTWKPTAHREAGKGMERLREDLAYLLLPSLQKYGYWYEGITYFNGLSRTWKTKNEREPST